MSHREKIRWVSLATMLIIWGVYFWRLAMALRSGSAALGEVLGGFVGAAILLVVIQVAATIAIALYRPSEAERPADPREREIERSAGKAAYAVLSLSVVSIMLAAPVLIVIAPTMLGRPTGAVGAMLMGNALLAALVLASLVDAIWQVVLYRRQS